VVAPLAVRVVDRLFGKGGAGRDGDRDGEHVLGRSKAMGRGYHADRVCALETAIAGALMAPYDLLLNACAVQRPCTHCRLDVALAALFERLLGVRQQEGMKEGCTRPSSLFPAAVCQAIINASLGQFFKQRETKRMIADHCAPVLPAFILRQFSRIDHLVMHKARRANAVQWSTQ